MYVCCMRKQIDLPDEAIKKIRILAAKEEKTISVKAFIQNIILNFLKKNHGSN